MEKQIPVEKMEQMKKFLNDHKRAYSRTDGQRVLVDEYEIYSPLHEFILSGLEAAFHDHDIYQSYHNEVLSWCDAFDRSEDPYALFADYIERRLGTLKGKHILEVGCGPIPVLSRFLAEKMRREDGTLDGSITAYDPDIVIRDDELPGVKLVRSLFEKGTKLPEDVVIVSMTPVVEAVQVIGLRVNEEKIHSIVKLGRTEGSDVRLALQRDKAYGLMKLSYEHSAYSGRDEQVISYLGDETGGKKM